MSEEITTNLLFFKEIASKEWKICKICISSDEVVINQIPEALKLRISLRDITTIKLFDYKDNTSMILIEYKDKSNQNNELVLKLPEHTVREIKEFLSYRISLMK